MPRLYLQTGSFITGAFCSIHQQNHKQTKPMKMHQKMRGGFTLVELLVVIVIIAALAGLTAPMVMRSRKKADATEAINNAKNIGLAMLEFETEYSSYPDDDTAQAVVDAVGGTVVSGTDANDYFRQLIKAGIAQSEKMFYAKIPDVTKPDENTQGDEALSAGEVGFGYMMEAAGDGFSASGNPSRPLCMTPLNGTQTDGTFATPPFDGKAIVLRMDNSVSSIPIVRAAEGDLDGTINLSGSGTDVKALLDVGDDTVWGDITAPIIVAPTIN